MNTKRRPVPPLRIFIRREKFRISRSDIHHVFGPRSRKILGRSSKDGVSSETVLRSPFFWAMDPQKFLKDRPRKWYREILACGVVECQGGIFLADTAKNKSKNWDNFSREVRTSGVWDAQGFSNHEHLGDYSKNRVVQLRMAFQQFDVWQNLLVHGNWSGDFVFYANGTREVTICLYRMKRIDLKFIKAFEKRIGLKRLESRNITVHL